MNNNNNNNNNNSNSSSDDNTKGRNIRWVDDYEDIQGDDFMIINGRKYYFNEFDDVMETVVWSSKNTCGDFAALYLEIMLLLGISDVDIKTLGQYGLNDENIPTLIITAHFRHWSRKFVETLLRFVVYNLKLGYKFGYAKNKTTVYRWIDFRVIKKIKYETPFHRSLVDSICRPGQKNRDIVRNLSYFILLMDGYPVMDRCTNREQKYSCGNINILKNRTLETYSREYLM